MTEALQVNRDESFVGQLKRLHSDMDFVNLGQSAMGPLEYRVILNRFRSFVAPDLSVFVFSYGDLEDLANSHLKIERTRDGVIRDIVLQPRANQTLKRALEPILQNCALATVVMRRIGRMIAHETGPLPFLFSRSLPDRKSADFVEILTFILNEAAARGPVMVMFLPQLEYKGDRRSYLATPSVEEASLFRRAAAQAGVPFFIPDQELQRQFAVTGQPGHGFANMRIGSGHLNALGHSAVAQGLAGFLARTLSASRE
jgi:hypothetical protein